MVTSAGVCLEKLLRNKDFLAGSLFILAGAIFFWVSRDYGMGTSRRMGPGYFPTVLSLLLTLIGAGVLLISLRSSEQVDGFSVRAFTCVILGTVIFGVLIRDAGILIAVVTLVLVAAAGNRESKWLPMGALAAGMALLCYGLFVKGLGMPIPIFGAWFSN